MEARDVKSRFWRISTAGICFQGGAAAVDSGTIIATLVHGLTGSVLAVGAATANRSRAKMEPRKKPPGIRARRVRMIRKPRNTIRKT